MIKKVYEDSMISRFKYQNLEQRDKTELYRDVKNKVYFFSSIRTYWSLPMSVTLKMIKHQSTVGARF